MNASFERAGQLVDAVQKVQKGKSFERAGQLVDTVQKELVDTVQKGWPAC